MALTDSIVSYWKLNESSDGSGAVTRNDSWSTNHLTDNNTTPSGTGILGNCVDIELSNNEYLSIADNTSLSITGNISISCWVKLESAPSNDNRAFVSKWNPTGNDRSYMFSYLDSGGTKYLQFNQSYNGTAEQTFVKAQTLNTGSWYFLVVTFNVSTGVCTFYVDGSSIGTDTQSALAIYNSNAAFVIGRMRTSDNTYQYDGLIDEVGLWSKVLTSTEVTELWNGGAGLENPLVINYSMDAAVGSFSLTGIEALLSKGKTLVASVGTFALTGVDAVITSSRSIVASVGAFTLTSINTLFSKAITVVIDTISYNVSFIEFKILYWITRTKPSTTFTNRTKPSTTFINRTKPSTTWTRVNK